MPDVPLSDQIEELELICLARSNLIARVKRGELHRPPEWLEKREKNLAALWAAVATLRGIAGRAA